MSQKIRKDKVRIIMRTTCTRYGFGSADQISDILKQEKMDEDILELLAAIDAVGDNETEKEEFVADGVIYRDDFNIVIEYTECEDSGMAGSVCRIVFCEARPEILSIVREGEMSTAFSFESGKRHKNTYNTPYGQFDFCVKTIKMENELRKRGRAYIDYIIELRGLVVEHKQIEMYVGMI